MRDLNGRLRLGMVGGGGSASIGPSHVAASRLDGRWELVAGAFSRDPDRAREAAARYRVDVTRTYGGFAEMAESESARADGIDAVTVCTLNDTHFEIVDAFLSKGIHVICDKPLVVSAAHARALCEKATKVGRVLAVTYTYSGYPMVRMARDIIGEGRLGRIVSVQVEYASHYQARTPETTWIGGDPSIGSALGVTAALGTHAFHLAEFVSGLRVEALAADTSALRHEADDHVNVMLRFRGGARGGLWTTSIAHGSANGLAIRVYGTDGGLSWRQQDPEWLDYCPSGDERTLFGKGGPGATLGARLATRAPTGHPEGYLEAFANIYTAVANAVAEGRTVPANDDFPDAYEGARGVGFVFAVQRSAQAGCSFVPMADP